MAIAFFLEIWDTDPSLERVGPVRPSVKIKTLSGPPDMVRLFAVECLQMNCLFLVFNV